MKTGEEREWKLRILTDKDRPKRRHVDYPEYEDWTTETEDSDISDVVVVEAISKIKAAPNQLAVPRPKNQSQSPKVDNAGPKQLAVIDNPGPRELAVPHRIET